jgi:hypothetical protein
MCRPNIDTNNPQGIQLGRFKNRAPARFEYIYCTLFPLCHLSLTLLQWYVTSVIRGSICEKYGNKCVKILKFWRTELSYAQNKNRGKKMRLFEMDTFPSLINNVNDRVRKDFVYSV